MVVQKRTGSHFQDHRQNVSEHTDHRGGSRLGSNPKPKLPQARTDIVMVPNPFFLGAVEAFLKLEAARQQGRRCSSTMIASFYAMPSAC